MARVATWGAFTLWTMVAAVGCGYGEAAPDGSEESVGEVASALTATANKALVITSTDVTRDSTRTADPCSAVAGDENKVWTIGHLLKREAEKNGLSPSTYAANWMTAWTSSATVNGDTVPILLGQNVRRNWDRFNGGFTSLPLHKAPFYLLAIVSRLDLRKHRPLGEPLGGEVRFVFGLLAATVNSPACPTTTSAAASTIILEYSPAKSEENQVKDFARRWLDLSTKSGSAYLTALQDLTEEVVNGGRLLRIRTNEGTESGKIGGTQSGWDFTEFEPNPTTKYLQRSTIKQAPSMALIDSTQVSDWIWANRSALTANAMDVELTNGAVLPPIGSYSVPNKFPGTQTWFRGGMNSIPSPTTEVWGGNYPNGLGSEFLMDYSDARFRFSVGTCRGCHGGDTATGMLHIVPSTPGSEAGRSSFLSGPVTAGDTWWNGQFSRTFDEMTRRENDLRGLVNSSPVLLPVLGNNYIVRFANSGKCLDSANNTNNDGDFSQLYTCHGNPNQRLSLVEVSAGVYNLKYKHSGKCIDVQNASTSDGARVVQMACNSARNSQKLTLSVLTGATPNRRLLRFQHSNRCLLVQNQATADTTAIVQGACPASNEFSKGFSLAE
jgi:hypothetical protein